ncbi:DUF2243 domain-containing protein [Verticiella sediminum]|uniref:DUF2243 domain-containing protein n=1 Tax=Verticiella sediminum TaxID=1247510 RepID=A0A556AZH8_9BURK|nr:DUF2243 domain-containing protein [Verticiella sediminum]TSH98328.1 DUF2243 domain-containing protein [Verticiella sediminum]
MQERHTGHARPRGQRLAIFLIGFALSGFFDGILLHQILEWHHLLSGIDRVAADLRLQIAADGFFHAAMYLVLTWGLALLVRHRHARALPWRAVLGTALYGFAAWHALDALLSHWILGIHRIRMDTANPLAWDLAWLAVFGLGPFLLGRWLLRTASGHPPGPGRGHATLALIALAATAAALNVQPLFGRAPTTLTVVMAPGKSFADAGAVLDAAGARLLWMDRSGGAYVVRAEGGISLMALLRSGAMYASGAGAVGGCGGYFVEPSSESRGRPARPA